MVILTLSNIFFEDDYINNKRVCDYATKPGRLEVFEWLVENNFSFDNTTCALAASKSNIDMLDFVLKRRTVFNSECTRMAAANGHTQTFEWLINNGCSVDKQSSYYAVSWCKKNGYDTFSSSSKERKPVKTSDSIESDLTIQL